MGIIKDREDKSMKHTPGPWRKQGNLILGYDIGVSIAKIFTKHIPGELSGAAEESANARLIAAAPELLETIEQLLWSLSQDKATQYVWIQKTKAIIAKARGEE